MDKRILKQFLKAGFVYRKKLFSTKQGSPQGGVISPIFANMTLDGIERKIKNRYWTNKKGTIDWRYNKHKVNYTRYADDFIVAADSREILLDIKRLITEHLKQRGLTLSEEKTLITHINQGFDFLGWNFRKYNGTLIGKPSKASCKSIADRIRRTVKGYRTAKQENLIRKLNPIITGWTAYHRSSSNQGTFSKLDHIIFRSIWNWAKLRHLNKSKQWIIDRYWKKSSTRSWIFTTGEYTLKFAARQKFIPHVIIKFDANPYLRSDDEYYSAREEYRKRLKSKMPPTPTRAVG